jgi:predicted ATPase
MKCGDGAMSDSTQHNVRTTLLDPVLLAAPFEVQTNWHVITGAACCGKTTLVDLLAEKGFQTVPEIPRQYIERELAKGRTLDELFGSEADERAVTDWQRQVEHGLRATDVIFLDRALPDFLWFWRLCGMNPNEPVSECLHNRYASVFILDMLPIRLNGARIDDPAYTVLLDEWLERDYSALGYHVVRVPVLSPLGRFEFVLKRLHEQGLI